MVDSNHQGMHALARFRGHVGLLLPATLRHYAYWQNLDAISPLITLARGKPGPLKTHHGRYPRSSIRDSAGDIPPQKFYGRMAAVADPAVSITRFHIVEPPKESSMKSTAK